MNAYADFLEREDSVLLLVDIQKLMLDPCVQPERVRRNASVLIKAAGILHIPVFFSVHNADKLGGFLPELIEKAVQPRLFNKLEFSCLQNESIARALLDTGRRSLLLAGLEAHICVFHTGAHALRLGYRVHVASDAVSSRTYLNMRTGLNRLEKAGGVVSSTEMIIYELLNQAGTPEFRAILPLLKTL